MVRFYRLLLCLLFDRSMQLPTAAPKDYIRWNIPSICLTFRSYPKTACRYAFPHYDLTIMIFWSQSCFPCLREMKSLEKFYPKAAKDNIGVMLISPASEWKDNAEERKFLAKYGAPTLPFYNDENNRLSLSLGIGSTPYTVIMNRSGKKVATIQGEADWNSEKLYKMIKKLIKPAQANPTAPAPLPAALPAVPASTTPASATHQAAPKPHDI